MSAWIELVKAKYALGKETCVEYTLKQAILAAKKEYKKPKTVARTQKRKNKKAKTLKKKRNSKK